MFENEIITKPIVSTEEDKKVISFFDKKDLKGQSFLSWGEHCTECSGFNLISKKKLLKPMTMLN